MPGYINRAPERQKALKSLPASLLPGGWGVQVHGQLGDWKVGSAWTGWDLFLPRAPRSRHPSETRNAQPTLEQSCSVCGHARSARAQRPGLLCTWLRSVDWSPGSSPGAAGAPRAVSQASAFWCGLGSLVPSATQAVDTEAPDLERGGSKTRFQALTEHHKPGPPSHSSKKDCLSTAG